VAGNASVEVEQHHFTGDRSQIKRSAAEAALAQLRRALSAHQTS